MKKLYPSIVALTFLFLSCGSEPQVGDNYEEISTKTKVVVDKVGLANELKEFYEEHNKSIRDETQTTDGEIGDRMLKIPIGYNVADANKMSVSFEGNRKMGIIQVRIITMEELKKNYKKID